MKIVSFNDIDQIQYPIESIAIGAFDGVHKGHQKLLKQALKLGNGNSAVVTFLQNPTKILFPNRYLGDILTFEQKSELFAKMGFKTLILIDFSDNFSKIKGEIFLNEILKIPQLRHVVVGPDFRCGNNGEMGADKISAILSSCNVSLNRVSFKKNGFKKISSSQIRKQLLRGQLKRAKRQLGHPIHILLPYLTKEYATELVIDRKLFLQVIPKTGIFSFISEKNEKGKIQFKNDEVHLYGISKMGGNTITLLNIIQGEK